MRRTSASGLRAAALGLLVIALGLTLPAIAGAARGVVGYFPFYNDTSGSRTAGQPVVVDAPGEVNTPAGVAVNGAGTGGASPGDVYVLDKGGPSGAIDNFGRASVEGRITQSSASGQPIRIWGRDVVASGPGQSDEAQTITVSASAGSFTLSVRHLAAVGAGSLIKGTDIATSVQLFSGAFQIGQRIESEGLLDGTTILDVEAKTLTLSQPANVTTEGADEIRSAEDQLFSLTATDESISTTSDLPFNATAAEVQAALNALPAINAGGGSVSVSGGPGGTAPYLVKFDGGPLGGTDQPLLVSGPGSPPLSGGLATAEVVTVSPGTAGFEICQPSAGDVCKQAPPKEFNSPYKSLPGALPMPTSVALDPASGDVYVSTSDRRITRFSATGELVHSWGLDAIASGPGDSNVNEQQRVKVVADGGAFTLRFTECFLACIPATTAPIPFDAPATGSGSVQQALNDAFEAADRIEGLKEPGFVTVTGGPGDAGGTTPYLITFHGAYGGDDVAQLESSAGGLTLSGPGTKLAEVTTDANGGALETCTLINVCKSASESDSLGRGFGSNGKGLAIAPPGAPNAGNVIVASHNATFRIVEYTNAGDFVRTFGWDVDATEPSTEFEVCTAASGHVCKKGTTGTGLGQFIGFNDPEAVAVDSTGAIYALDGPTESVALGRVQKFTPSAGLDLTPSLAGADELQTATVNATAGQYRLGIVDPDGTEGTGFLTTGSSVVKNVTTATGAFEVGQPIRARSGGIPLGTTIAAIGADTITLSRPATTFTFAEVILSPRLVSTGDLAAGASAAEVQAALNGLSPINADGASVTVTGGPGGAGGGTPYAIAFDGGLLAKTDPPQLVPSPGSTPLSGGVGSGADAVEIATATPGGPNGRSLAEAPVDIAVGADDSLLVAKRFPTGAATCVNGSPSVDEVRVQELTPDGAIVETSRPCTNLSAVPRSFSSSRSGPYLAADTVTGDPYLFEHSDRGNDRPVYIFGDPGPFPDLALNPLSDESASGVRVSGALNPNGPLGNMPSPASTTYRVEYKKSSDTDWTLYLPDTSVGHGTSMVPFNVGISGLTPNTSYDTRVTATKAFDGGTVVGPTQTFTTKEAAPTIDAFFSSGVTATSADLHAVINPLGTATSYHFEYGTTPAYGLSTPETAIGSSQQPVAVEDHIEDLESRVYHFRVVAENSQGITVSTNQTFNFYPESCPNAMARQQTGSDALPDCRAYELVSPGNSGGSFLSTGGPNPSFASGPPRFAFLGSIGAIPGPWNPPNSISGDPYVATRTSTGWTTAYVGLPANETLRGTAAPRSGSQALLSNDGLDLFLQWIERGSYAPYARKADGSFLGRLPTNLEQVPGGDTRVDEGGFIGELALSRNGEHYLFSSANIAFAPGGLTSGTGSAYDNDIANGTVTVISKLSNGDDIPQDPANHSNDYLKIPGVSADGSHALLATVGPGGFCSSPIGVCPDPPNVCGSFTCPVVPVRLYMRDIPAGLTYDVSRGNLVTYEGMTGDGSTVYFSSDQQITTDDNDSSVDLFMWNELSDSVIRVSMGSGGIGDSDSCSSAWSDGCGIEVVPSTGGDEKGPASDNSIARESGDVYFYSPEQFVGANGIPGQRNLYVSRGGELLYVATLQSSKPLTRIQVSPDGDHSAFVTASQLTSSDNGGHQTMYSYEAESGNLRCVSCPSNGDPPGVDVRASENGLFMANDGRTFFGTTDALVAQDTNQGGDVYEFVDSRPRLITSGVGAADEIRPTGFVAVSANGVDVFFSTIDTLVPQDENGAVTKFYTARTNGGFQVSPPLLPCAAADECHGPDSAPPPPRGLGSAASLGNSGNVRKAASKKKKKQRKKHRGKRHRRNHGQGRR